MRRSLGTSELEPAELEVSPMKRRHLKGVMAIERQVYPRPWSPSLFISEMSETSNRSYLVARLGRDVVAYGGGIFLWGGGGHTKKPRPPPYNTLHIRDPQTFARILDTTVAGVRQVVDP